MNIYCPHCAQRIELTRAGIGETRLLRSILLQAERFGAEIHCEQCHGGFLYTRLQHNHHQPEQVANESDECA